MHCAEISGCLKRSSKVGQLPRFLLATSINQVTRSFSAPTKVSMLGNQDDFAFVHMMSTYLHHACPAPR